MPAGACTGGIRKRCYRRALRALYYDRVHQVKIDHFEYNRLLAEAGLSDDHRTRHQVKIDHFEYKQMLAEDGLSDETSEDPPLSSLTSEDSQ